MPRKPPSPFDATLGTIIHRLRINRGMTLKDAAKKIGVTSWQFTKYEKGKSQIAIETMMIVGDLLGIDGTQVIKAAWDERNTNKDIEPTPETSKVRQLQAIYAIIQKLPGYKIDALKKFLGVL